MTTKERFGTKQLFQKVPANNWRIIRELYSTANNLAWSQLLPGANDLTAENGCIRKYGVAWIVGWRHDKEMPIT